MFFVAVAAPFLVFSSVPVLIVFPDVFVAIRVPWVLVLLVVPLVTWIRVVFCGFPCRLCSPWRFFGSLLSPAAIDLVVALGMQGLSVERVPCTTGPQDQRCTTNNKVMKATKL